MSVTSTLAVSSEELKEQSRVCRGDHMRASYMKDLSCVSSQKLFSLAQSRGSACNLLIGDSESAGLLSLVAGHQAAKMCLQLSLPLDQAPRD